MVAVSTVETAEGISTMKTLAVTVAPWSALRDKGRITKALLREHIKPGARYEFITIGGFDIRSGAALTVDEAVENGVDMLEVRSDDHVNLIAGIYLTEGKVRVQ